MRVEENWIQHHCLVRNIQTDKETNENMLWHVPDQSYNRIIIFWSLGEGERGLNDMKYSYFSSKAQASPTSKTTPSLSIFPVWSIWLILCCYSPFWYNNSVAKQRQNQVKYIFSVPIQNILFQNKAISTQVLLSRNSVRTYTNFLYYENGETNIAPCKTSLIQVKFQIEFLCNFVTTFWVIPKMHFPQNCFYGVSYIT